MYFRKDDFSAFAAPKSQVFFSKYYGAFTPLKYSTAVVH